MTDYEKEKARIKKELDVISAEIDSYKFAEYSNHLMKQIDDEISKLENMKDELSKYRQLAPFQITEFISDLEDELSNVHNFYGSVGSIYNKLSCLRVSILKLYNAKIEQPTNNKSS